MTVLHIHKSKKPLMFKVMERNISNFEVFSISPIFYLLSIIYYLLLLVSFIIYSFYLMDN